VLTAVLQKKRVQWLIEHSTSHQLLCYVDSLVLRNPLLRKAANRYDQKIIEIYQRVGSAFREASNQRGEHIPAGHLNTVVLKFFQVYEMMGDTMFYEHLKYEVDKYIQEGLRPDYKQDLKLF
jgi:hypothetical protein